MTKFVSYDNLSSFFSKLKNIFSDINHTHTSSDVVGLEDSINTLQTNMDSLEQAVNDLTNNMSYSILPITQDEYDALEAVDENTLYIIEV